MALRRLVEMPIGNYSPPKSKLRGPRAQRVNDPVQVAGSKWQMSGEKRECVDVLCRYLGPLGRQLVSDVQFYCNGSVWRHWVFVTELRSVLHSWLDLSVWGLEKPSHYFKIVLSMQLTLPLGFVGTPASTSSSFD